MNCRLWVGLLSLMFLVWGSQGAQAQPSRQLPGVGTLLKMGPQQGAPPNTRVRPAASQVGLESTDFYPKRGYPRFLGDAVEAGSAAGGGQMGGQVGQAGQMGQTGQFGGGFQGNIGNQIGQNTGGTIFGGIFGGGQGGGGGVQGVIRGGFTGGGFTGVVPKGLGFGGAPDPAHSWFAPLNGATGR